MARKEDVKIFLLLLNYHKHELEVYYRKTYFINILNTVKLEFSQQN